MKARLAFAIGSIIALAACSSGTPAAPGGGVASQAPSAPAASGAMTPSVAPATTTQVAPASNPTPTAASGGAVPGFSLITAARAGALLGAAATGKMANVTPGASIRKIDGCNYTSSAGSLGYDVNQIPGMSGIDYIGAAKKGVAAEPGVTIIPTTGGDASVGYMIAAGANTMVRIEIAKGDTTIGVAAVGADKALMQSVALAAASDLVAAV